jgi:hypothetical protein
MKMMGAKIIDHKLNNHQQAQDIKANTALLI